MFKNKRTPAPNVSIKLNGISIERVDEVKYVGILFDEYLTFKGHIKVLNAKLKRANNLLAINQDTMYQKNFYYKSTMVNSFHTFLMDANFGAKTHLI
jgi:hypothetical protein